MRNLLSLSLLSLSFLMSLNARASLAPNIASVVKIRGTVTKLLPGRLEASVVMADDKFPEDTSIVTGPKSFIKIKFIDNSELNMGPDSKIVISEMSADSVGIISLLKGRIRTEVQKAINPVEQTNNKFYIRTRTAAMGVRGTDFQTIYNPDNRMTSLLTYKGAVAIAKIDESTHKRFEEGTTTIERVDKDHAPEIKQIPERPMLEKEMLVYVLNNANTVVVPPGQNSFTSNALKKSSLPVKISPLQLNALYKNQDFEEKSIVNLKSGLDVKNPKLEITAAPQVAPVDGLFNAKSGDFAPRAGGFIDQQTGLYIAPDASAQFDDKNGVYSAQKTGNFDADTGDYFAPKGLILDAKRGFILEKNADVKPELLVLREDMNKSIARDTVVGDLEGEVMLAAKTLREKFIRDRLIFSLKSGTQKLDLTVDNGASTKRDSQADGAFDMSILWQMASSNRFSPLLGLTYARVGYGNLSGSGDLQDSKSLFSMTTGLKYALTNRIDLVTMLMLNQAHYANQLSSSPNTYQFKNIVMSRLNLGVEALLIRSNRFSLMGQLLGNMAFRKRYNNQVVSEVSGFNLKLTPQYEFSEKKALGIGVFASMEKAKITNGLGSTDQERNDLGLELKYTVDL